MTDDTDKEASLVQKCLAALRQKDMARINRLIPEITPTNFEADVLAVTALDSLEWFWREAHSKAGTFEYWSEVIVTVLISHLVSNGYQPGCDFSRTTSDSGLPVLLVNSAAYATARRAISPKRWAAARLFLRSSPSRTQ